MSKAITFIIGVLVGVCILPIKHAVVDYAKGNRATLTGLDIGRAHDRTAARAVRINEREIGIIPADAVVIQHPDARPLHSDVEVRVMHHADRRSVLQWMRDELRLRGVSDEC